MNSLRGFVRPSHLSMLSRPQGLRGDGLLSPSGFRDLVSGRRRGLGPLLVRSLLRLAESPYTAVVRWRNRRYDSGAAPAHRMAVPVVSVGNLTLGGTGKTPMVEWLARWFVQRDVRVAVVSRGYGARQGGPNDEALELRERLPGVMHVQNPDRVEGALQAIRQADCQLIFLDDAFQHRRIDRQLDLVLLDALEPFGFGHVFPRGTLREPVEGLGRAHALLLTRADQLSPAQREEIRGEAVRYAPQALWAEVVHAPQVFRSAAGAEQPLASLAGQPVAAFCGLGNPAGFRRTLEACACRVVDFREFADHYRYSPADVDSLARWAEGLDVVAVVCTHKDLVKLGAERLGRLPLWAVTIALEFLVGQEALEARLEELLPVR